MKLKWILLFALVARPCAAQDLWLKNAQLVNPATRTVRHGDLLILGGRVALPTTRKPPGLRVVDLHNRYVLPSFIDTHVHSWGNVDPVGEDEEFGLHGTAKRMLYCGVTAFLDLGSTEKLILPARDHQRALRSPLNEAEILAAGPVFMSDRRIASGPQRSRRVVNTPQDAEREVADLARKHPDVIKIIYDDSHTPPTMNEDVMAAVIRAATRAHIKTVVHIGTWDNARKATAAGASAITHLWEEDDIPDDVVALMKAHGTYSIPTQAVQADFLHFAQSPELLKAPLLREVTSARVLHDYATMDRTHQNVDFTLDWQRKGHASLNRSLGKLYRAGVPIMTGDDTGNLGTFQGFSLHREIELLQEAGLTNWDALAAATTVPARFLGLRSGIEPGDWANLVVLRHDPTRRLRATQDIDEVILRGRIVDRKALRRSF